MNNIIDIAEDYVTQKWGKDYAGDFFLIDYYAPMKCVRGEVKAYLGDGITVTNDDVPNIIQELNFLGYEWVIHKATGITFMAGDPNNFITAVAMVIEL